MADESTRGVEEFLNGFAEAMSRLLLEQYQGHFAEFDLTLPQAQVLRLLVPGPVPTGQLASELKISASAVTQLTNRLATKRLVERRAAESDRRLVLVALSAKGRRLVEQFRARRSRLFGEALARLGEDDRRQVVEALGKVLAALESLRADGARAGGGRRG